MAAHLNDRKILLAIVCTVALAHVLAVALVPWQRHVPIDTTQMFEFEMAAKALTKMPLHRADSKKDSPTGKMSSQQPSLVIESARGSVFPLETTVTPATGTANPMSSDDATAFADAQTSQIPKVTGTLNIGRDQASSTGVGGKAQPVDHSPSEIPAYLHNPKPEYPSGAVRLGIQGEVLLRVEVLETGRVGRIDLTRSSGHEVLDQAAIKAVQGWRFKPAQQQGSPLSQWVEIPIPFKLR